MMIELFQRLFCGYLCKNMPASPFTILRHQSWRHFLLVLQKKFPNAMIRIADKYYSAPIKQEFEAWLKSDPTNEHQYHAEWYDCDDFAMALRCAMFQIVHELNATTTLETTITLAYCEGHVAGVRGRHAFNLLIDDQDRIFIIEPQNDTTMPASESIYIPDFIQL